MRLNIFIIALLLFNITYSYTISGTIIDKTSGEPLPYCNIMIANTERGTATDVNGYYIIPNVSDGDYTLIVLMIGYEKSEQKINVNKNMRINFELVPQPIQSDEIKVSAERMRFEKRVDVSRVNLTNQEIRKAPAFIEADLFRTLQLLPSVNASNDFNAALIVRGGSPDENLILLDGTEIYNPYHIGGVFSTFNADMISDSEFLAGGFPANYGGRLSSVLNVTAREGDSRNGVLKSKGFNTISKFIDFSKGSGDISLLSSKIMAEGFLYNGSWMFSARRTYFDKFVDAYYKYYKDETTPSNYYFWDTHFKAKTSLNNSNQFIYSQFSGKDDLFLSLGGNGFPSINFNWDWGNNTKSLTWKFIPNYNYIINTSISKTEYDFNVNFGVDFTTISSDPVDSTEILAENGAPDLTVKIDNIVEDIDLKQNIKYIFSDNLSFDAGWQLKYLNLSFNRNFIGSLFELGSKPEIQSTFISSTWNPFPLLYLNTGFRLSKYNKYDNFLIDPRIGMKININSDLVVKMSWGKYSQFLYTTNEEDELLRIVDFWQPIPDGKMPQQSMHYIVGTEYWISEGNTFSIESYYKNYSNIYDLNPLADPNDVANTIAISGTAEAYGFELLYRLNKNNLSGWLSYAYSNITREVDLNSDGVIWNEKEIYPAKYDKPHSFNSVLSYSFAKKYSLGISTVFGSGQTYTPVIGKTYQAGQSIYGSLENPYTRLGNIFGAKNSSRYPNYFRMDISLTRETNLAGIEGKLKFQIINLTNYYNVLLYNWNHSSSPSKVEAYSMFPAIFTFGWEFKF